VKLVFGSSSQEGRKRTKKLSGTKLSEFTSKRRQRQVSGMRYSEKRVQMDRSENETGVESDEKLAWGSTNCL